MFRIAVKPEIERNNLPKKQKNRKKYVQKIFYVLKYTYKGMKNDNFDIKGGKKYENKKENNI